MQYILQYIYIYMIYTLVHLDIRSSFDAFFDGFPIFSIVLSSSWLTIWATAICFSMIVDVWIISCPVLKHWIISWFVGQPKEIGWHGRTLKYAQGRYIRDVFLKLDTTSIMAKSLQIIKETHMCTYIIIYVNTYRCKRTYIYIIYINAYIYIYMWRHV